MLKIEGLELALGEFTLGELSLDLADGDYLALMGPSGCGKTTLLKTIAGICVPDRGRILLDGMDVTALPPQRRRVGWVPQDSDLFPHLDAAGNIAFGLRYSGLDRAAQRERLAKLAGLLGLEGLLGRFPATLSGGEARRVALARALAVSPRILLLDEPLGMLDLPARRALLDALRRVHEELGTSAIHVTHEQDEARALGEATRGAVMRAGRIEQVGTMADLFARPATPFVAGFLGVEPLSAAPERRG